MTQDGAPLHYATGVQNWLNSTFNNKWIGRGGPVQWLPRSPNLTSCDYFLCGYFKEQVFQTSVDNADELRRRITAACETISPEILTQ